MGTKNKTWRDFGLDLAGNLASSGLKFGMGKMLPYQRSSIGEAFHEIGLKGSLLGVAGYGIETGKNLLRSPNKQNSAALKPGNPNAVKLPPVVIKPGDWDKTKGKINKRGEGKIHKHIRKHANR